MKYTHFSESARFAPLALAVALLAILGLVALSVHAEEESDTTSIREEVGENIEQQQTLLEEQKEERVEMRIEQREKRQGMLEERATALKEELGLRKLEREQNMQTFKAKLSLEVQTRLGEYTARVAERMNAATNRLEQIADRVLTRLEKIEEEKGVELSDARDELEQVYIAIVDARANIKIFKDFSTDTITSDTPGAKTADLREAAKLAKDSIKAIHTGLSNTVQLIKVGMVEKVGDSEEDAEENDEE